MDIVILLSVLRATRPMMHSTNDLVEGAALRQWEEMRDAFIDKLAVGDREAYRAAFVEITEGP